MRKQITIISLFLVLTACAPFAIQSPIATLTPTPLPSETWTPSLTPSPSPTNSITPTPTMESFSWTLQTAENFRICSIQTEDVMVQENGKFLRWLRTLSKPFDKDAIFYSPQVWSWSGDPYLVYSPGTEGLSSVLLRTNIAACSLIFEGNEYFIFPIEFGELSNLGSADNNSWVIGVIPAHAVSEGRPEQTMKFGEPLSDSIMKSIFNKVTKKNNLPGLIIGFRYQAGKVPLVERYWQLIGNEVMKQKFDKFVNGDIHALDGAIVLLTTLGLDE